MGGCQSKEDRLVPRLWFCLGVVLHNGLVSADWAYSTSDLWGVYFTFVFGIFLWDLCRLRAGEEIFKAGAAALPWGCM